MVATAHATAANRTNNLDETRLAESLTDSPRGVPFLKGRQVFPFRVEPGNLRIDPKKRAIPGSVREPRLAWRDVARPSVKRRMPLPDCSY